jgi:hypothetical protein
LHAPAANPTSITPGRTGQESIARELVATIDAEFGSDQF